MNLKKHPLLVLAICWNAGYYAAAVFADDGVLRTEDLTAMVRNILGNDTVLLPLLQRYPEFHAIVAHIVNQTISYDTTTAIDEDYICNVAKSAINDSTDTCLDPSANISSSCFFEQNITETTNASVSQLCEKIEESDKSTPTTRTVLEHARMVVDTTPPSKKLITATALHNTIQTNVFTTELATGAINGSRNDSAVTSGVTSTKWPKKSSKSQPRTFPMSNAPHMQTTVPLGTMPPVFSELPATNAPVPTTPFSGQSVLPSDLIKDVPSSYFFLAIKLAVKTAIVSFERKCRVRNGIYVKEKHQCIIALNKGTNETSNLTLPLEQNPNMINRNSLRLLHIIGNSCSILATVLLFVEYFICKNQLSIFDKSILSLTFALLLSHLIQLLITFLSWNKQFCKVGGILLHWALLCSFAWMSIISFDIFKTFRSTQLANTRSRKQYIKYFITALFLSTAAVLACVFLGIPTNDYSGYGYQGRCFIGKFWASVFSFIFPVAFSLLLNTTLMIVTLVRIHRQQKRSAKALSGSSSQRSSSRKKVVISLLTLKLSVLFGLGWFLGFIDGLTSTSVLPFAFTGIVSLEGVLVFMYFGYHKSTLTKCSARCSRNLGSPILKKKIARNAETETTQL